MGGPGPVGPAAPGFRSALADTRAAPPLPQKAGRLQGGVVQRRPTEAASSAKEGEIRPSDEPDSDGSPSANSSRSPRTRDRLFAGAASRTNPLLRRHAAVPR